MRIALLSDLFYPYQLGGAERQFFEIATRLAKKHEVHVFTLNLFGQEKDEIYRNVHIHRFGLKHPLKHRLLLPLLSYLVVFLYLLKDLHKFDIIHANQGMSCLFSVLKSKKPFIATLHDIYWDQWSIYYSYPSSLFGKLLEFLWSKGEYNKIITVSNYSKQKIWKLGFKAPIDVIPNGIDLKMINKIKTKKKNHIVYIGRLVNYKHVDILIKSMKEVQDRFSKLELHIIGSGEQKNYLEKLAKTLHVKVNFFGFVSERKKFEELKSARVFVSMSSVEGFGISLLEAMACGTPVIARNLGCYNEFCNKNNSILISSKNENEMQKNFTKKIINLLRNKNLENKLIKNGLKIVKHFDWDIVAKKIEYAYSKLLINKYTENNYEV